MIAQAGAAAIRLHGCIFLKKFGMRKSGFLTTVRRQSRFPDIFETLHSARYSSPDEINMKAVGLGNYVG